MILLSSRLESSTEKLTHINSKIDWTCSLKTKTITYNKKKLEGIFGTPNKTHKLFIIRI